MLRVHARSSTDVAMHACMWKASAYTAGVFVTVLVVTCVLVRLPWQALLTSSKSPNQPPHQTASAPRRHSVTTTRESHRP